MNFTIEEAIEHLQGMAERLKEMGEKYPKAKFNWVRLSLNWGKLNDARRDWDWIAYWSINWQEMWIDLSFTTKEEDEE